MTDEQLIKALKGVQYIVINRCYGGFGLSPQAEKIYKEMAGITDTNWYDREVARDDPYLVKIVQDLGKAADGAHAELSIIEIPADVEWQIEEYDGIEWVAEKHRVWR